MSRLASVERRATHRQVETGVYVPKDPRTDPESRDGMRTVSPPQVQTVNLFTQPGSSFSPGDTEDPRGSGSPTLHFPGFLSSRGAPERSVFAARTRTPFDKKGLFRPSWSAFGTSKLTVGGSNV